MLLEDFDGNKVLAIRCKKCNQLLRCREHGWVRCKKCGIIYNAPESKIGLPVVPSKSLTAIPWY